MRKFGFARSVSVLRLHLAPTQVRHGPLAKAQRVPVNDHLPEALRKNSRHAQLPSRRLRDTRRWSDRVLHMIGCITRAKTIVEEVGKVHLLLLHESLRRQF